jgi:hypothetical protein
MNTTAGGGGGVWGLQVVTSLQRPFYLAFFNYNPLQRPLQTRNKVVTRAHCSTEATEVEGRKEVGSQLLEWNRKRCLGMRRRAKAHPFERK